MRDPDISSMLNSNMKSKIYDLGTTAHHIREDLTPSFWASLRGMKLIKFPNWDIPVPHKPSNFLTGFLMIYIC